MAIHAAQLLKQLEPAVRPGGALAPGLQPHKGLEFQGFDDLLAKASAGQLRSGRQIDVAFDASPPLNAAQLERLAAAADQVEAAGARQALMLIDGRALVLDVQSRTLTSELSPTQAAGVQKIDAAMVVGSLEPSSSSVVQPPGQGAIPASVLKQLLRQ